MVLTGGNDLAALGGDAPERDATENALLDAAESRRLPVIGVCRGMQVIQAALCGAAAADSRARDAAADDRHRRQGD